MWPRVLGPQRAKYFLYTRQTLSAREAHALGVVAEVLPTPRGSGRARSSWRASCWRSPS
jgi:enoyl-CoA hydratase/carnithine racemase